MTTLATPHPLDRLADFAAPTVLAAAAGWSAWSVSSPALAMIGAALGFAGGMAAMRTIGKPISATTEFVPAEFENHADVDGELLLVDALTDYDPSSRVVRLFAREDTSPGELAARIADFLGEGTPPVAAAAESEELRHPADASAALHTALANIRASLR